MSASDAAPLTFNPVKISDHRLHMQGGANSIYPMCEYAEKAL